MNFAGEKIRAFPVLLTSGLLLTTLAGLATEGADDPPWQAAEMDAWSYAVLGDLIFRHGYE